MTRIRCAIYTRKSSEEGLEQDFNSLDAQREACAAYVLSQASEGWQLVKDHYDDGGLSGGTLERPALQRLLGAVEAGHVDIIVVYKVDRLTRSLLDFAKLVEAFDRKGVSFVSVTQSFNTTTSMGRLTLNMLLSFAQFEREVTAERIRDKLAASKAKGMWMGGTPPLGYQPNGRSLAIVEDHANLIRHIYRRYRELGAVRLLSDELRANGLRWPERTTSTGRAYGGGFFSRGQLYAILNNPIYKGCIAHRQRVSQPKGLTTRETKVHPGNHPPIIDAREWDAVQHHLTTQTQGVRRGRAPGASLLAGVLVDEAGEPLIAVHATKNGGSVSATRRYRYYVSKGLHHRTNEDPAPGVRIPAREIEQLVITEVSTLFADPLDLATRAGLAIGPADLPRLTAGCEKIGAELQSRAPELLRALLRQVRICPSGIAIDLSIPALCALLGLKPHSDAAPLLTLEADVRLTRTGRAMRLVQAGGATALPNEADPALVKLLLRARHWWKILSEGEMNPAALAAREGVTVSWLQRVVCLAFLAPTVVEAILDGRTRAGVDAAMLLQADTIAPLWEEQQAMLVAR